MLINVNTDPLIKEDLKNRCFMLLENKLTMPFDQTPVSHKVWWKCDYCGIEFEREIKVMNRASKINPKHSCGSKDCKNKKKQEGCLAKYGVSHVSQIEEIKLKKNQKIKEKMPETLKKMKQANLEKYGHEYASQTIAAKEKMKQTCLQKYGTKSSLQNEQVKQKTKQTNLKNFGVEFPMQSEEIKAKREETNLAKFGFPHASQSEEVKNKIIESNLKNYGVPFVGMREDVQEKIIQTNIARYGVANPLENEEINNRRKSTNLEKYGHESALANKDIKNKIKETNIAKYGHERASQSPEVIEKMITTNIEKYGVPAACMLVENRIYGKTQKELTEWLNGFGFVFKTDRTILDGREIDSYDDNLKIGFEYCGLYWHNELSPEPITRSYHYNKYKICQDKGIRLVTIFEDEWIKRNAQCKNFIKSILNKNSIKIFARKCQVKQIEKTEFQSFCNDYHIQGANHLAIVCYGLFYNDELIGGMSFGKHHRNGKDLTLDRLCFKDDVSVVGGSSKLFNACLLWAKEKGYDRVVSWSDNRWSAGDVYKKLGFELATDGKPDYSYVDLTKKCSRRSKQSQKKLVPSKETERQICLEKGLVRIWDCGKKKWVFNIKS